MTTAVLTNVGGDDTFLLFRIITWVLVSLKERYPRRHRIGFFPVLSFCLRIWDAWGAWVPASLDVGRGTRGALNRQREGKNKRLVQKLLYIIIIYSDLGASGIPKSRSKIDGSTTSKLRFTGIGDKANVRLCPPRSAEYLELQRITILFDLARRKGSV